MEALLRIYSLYYCYVLEFFRTRGWNWAYESKAIITLLLLEMAIVFAIGVYVMARFSISVPGVPHGAVITIPLAVAIYMMNYFLLLRGNRWKRYDAIRKSYSSRANLTGGILSILVSISVPIFVIVLMYQAGRIIGSW